jgi:hypothetical protein
MGGGGGCWASARRVGPLERGEAGVVRPAPGFATEAFGQPNSFGRVHSGGFYDGVGSCEGAGRRTASGTGMSAGPAMPAGRKAMAKAWDPHSSPGDFDPQVRRAHL